MDTVQRPQMYEAFLKEVTARVLGVDVASVTSNVKLFDLGLDSVTGMMIMSIIERSTSFKLPAVSVLSGEATVASLALALNDIATEME